VKVAYVDTSWLLSIAFGEAGAEAAAAAAAACDVLMSAPLLEAELMAALRREGVAESGFVDPGISWVLPDRSLRAEIGRVLDAGYLRGADLWHVATALYAAADPTDTLFLTRDARQAEVARSLGFVLAPAA
jgi:predicted nucleic acid-binding protein